MRGSGRTTRGIEAAHLFASMGFRVFYVTQSQEMIYAADLYRKMSLSGASPRDRLNFTVFGGELWFRSLGGIEEILRGRDPKRHLVMLDHAIRDEDINESLRATLVYFSQALHR